jgi:hypothetical protein
MSLYDCAIQPALKSLMLREALLMKIEEGFIEYAEKKTDLMRNIIEELEKCDFGSPSVLAFGTNIAALIADEHDDFKSKMEVPDSEDVRDYVGEGYNGAIR